LKLEKSFYTTNEEQAQISVIFSTKVLTQQSFKIYAYYNDGTQELLDSITEEGDYDKAYKFDYKGQITITMAYERFITNLKINQELGHNALTINKISITGTSVGGGVFCKKCPIGFIRKDLSKNECEICGKGETSNENSNYYIEFLNTI